MKMPCLRCGKPSQGAYSRRCICSPSQKDIYYKSIQGAMQIASGSKCANGRLDITREAIKRRLINKSRRERFERMFPIKQIDAGIIAVKLKVGEGKVFLRKGEPKLTKMGRAKNHAG